MWVGGQRSGASFDTWPRGAQMALLQARTVRSRCGNEFNQSEAWKGLRSGYRVTTGLVQQKCHLECDSDWVVGRDRASVWHVDFLW
ncbi:unnamed protein product [Sphagnum troendelagicum]|uniref:RNase H type-1 domain-containing protein n=1 Tax=Sphagnum troendelagicum TaxID=128251 RepID=A0ABP0TVZ9_9BRYO